MAQANRLIHETSPYLLQHARNPVDWYPWGPEALARAKAEHKPILVSIGYSACHWCHVMERESFENEAIAQIMNDGFVCIKVDREERPDVDAVYMDAVQAMGVRGGWPLNVFLMPDAKPFYGLTYLPPHNWAQLLGSIRNAFRDNYQALEQSAEGFVRSLQLTESEKYDLSGQGGGIGPDGLDQVFEVLKKQFDPHHGGMNRAPKFPMPSIYRFLLRYYDISQNPEALQHLELSLHRMALGGIYDHVGGGWARYSVDGEWFIPHFEKMLYDNGQLLSVYSEAFSLTTQELYRNRVYGTIHWLAAEMLSEEGGFYAALDADSEGIEGKYYVWTAAELREALGEDFEWFASLYGITEEGNWEHGYNHLHLTALPHPPSVLNRPDEAAFRQTYYAALDRLATVRKKRTRPGLDDKILASWNGLALKGLIDAYKATGDEYIRSLALRNASFIRSSLLVEGRLFHTYKNGKASVPGFLDDYAAVADAFAALYQITFDETWLHDARLLTDYTITNFYNEQEGFFYFTDAGAEALIARKTELFDNVIPSSNSLMGHALFVLGTLFDEARYVNIARDMAFRMARLVREEAPWVTNWASLHCLLAAPTAEIVIIGPEADTFRKDLDRFFVPNKIVLGSTHASLLPLARDKTAIQGKTTLYVCFNRTCLLPVHSVEEAVKQLAFS